MNTEYAEYYQQAADAVQRFGETVSHRQFNEKDQAVEVFALQALAVCRDHCRAISTLLRGGAFAEPIIISRSLFELFFNLHWIISADSREHKLERVYQLEANPYYEFAKEVRLIEEDSNGPSPHWSPKKAKEFREALVAIESSSPFLLRVNTDGLPEFKKAPPLASRMGNDIRLRFYNIYRFTSFFTHPTPSLKQVYLRQTGSTQTPADIMQEPLNQTLAYCLWFVELVVGYCSHIFEQYNVEQLDTRRVAQTELFTLVEKANKGYFGTSSHKRSHE